MLGLVISRSLSRLYAWDSEAMFSSAPRTGANGLLFLCISNTMPDDELANVPQNVFSRLHQQSKFSSGFVPFMDILLIDNQIIDLEYAIVDVR